MKTEVKEIGDTPIPKFINKNTNFEFLNNIDEIDTLSPESNLSMLFATRKENIKFAINYIFDFKDDCNIKIVNNNKDFKPNLLFYKTTFENYLRDTENFLKNKYKSEIQKRNNIPSKIHKLRVKMILKIILEIFSEDENIFDKNIFSKDLNDQEINKNNCFVLALEIPINDLEYIKKLSDQTKNKLSENEADDERVRLNHDIRNGHQSIILNFQENEIKTDYANLLLDSFSDLKFSNPKLYFVFKEVVSKLFNLNEISKIYDKNKNNKCEFLLFIKTFCVFLSFSSELNTKIKLMDDCLHIYIFAGDESLMKEAEKANYQFAMSEEGKRKCLSILYGKEWLDNSDLIEKEIKTTYTKSLMIPYTPNSISFLKLYNKNDDTKMKNINFDVDKFSILKSLDRIRLVNLKIENCLNIKNLRKFKQFKSLTIKRNPNNNNLLDIFSLYKNNTSNSLTLLNFLNIFSENYSIKISKVFHHFYGEKISFYFSWTFHLLKWIIYLCIILIIISFMNRININDKLTLNGVSISKTIDYISAFLFSIWFTLYIRSWKALETTLAVKWGTSEIPEKIEKDRYDFFSPCNVQIFSSQIPKESKFKNLLAGLTSFLITFVMIVLSVTSLIYLQEIQLPQIKKKNELDLLFATVIKKDNKDTFYTFLPYLIGFYIKFLSKIYDHVCRRLTENENHKKDRNYMNSFLFKNTVFNLINHYITFYYIVFIKAYYHTCAVNCYDYLTSQVNKILFTYFLAAYLEMLLPWLNNILINYQIRNKVKLANPECNDKKLNLLIEEYRRKYNYILLPRYDYINLVKEYLNIILLLGYATQFSVCNYKFLFLFLIYIIIQRISYAYKIINFYNVNVFSQAKNIGVFNKIMKTVSILSSFITLYIIFFLKGGDDKQIRNVDNWYTFIIAQNVMFILIFLIDFAFTPNWVSYYKQIRQDFIRMKETYISDRIIEHVNSLNNFKDVAGRNNENKIIYVSDISEINNL